MRLAMRAKLWIPVLAVVVVVLGGGLALQRWLFRVELRDEPSGRFDIRFRWGRPAEVTSDKDRDGMWDSRALLQDDESAMSLSPLEFWDDEDLDGRVEIHAVLTGPPHHPGMLWEVDTDGDGHYDTRMTGVKAEQAYRDWLDRRVDRVPELFPKPDPQALAGAGATDWHVYECPPISLRGEGVVTVSRRLEMLAGAETVRVDSFVLLFEAAVELVADLTTWDGGGTWVVAAVPDVERGEMRLMFLVEQSTKYLGPKHPRRKNAEDLTFIASTTELPWLAAYERRAAEGFQPGQRNALAVPHIRHIRYRRRQGLERGPLRPLTAPIGAIGAGSDDSDDLAGGRQVGSGAKAGDLDDPAGSAGAG